MYINIDSYLISNNTNGPGRRLVLWLQGCTLACKGCFNPHLWAHKPNKLLEVGDLSKYLIDKMREFDCEGITLSGGEPFQQAKASVKLIEKIKTHNYSIVIYTGFSSRELRNSNNPSIERLLELSDILIAGRYREIVTEARTWDENKDKELIFKNKSKALNNFEPANVEFILSMDNLLVTGFPSEEEINELKDFSKLYAIELI